MDDYNNSDMDLVNNDDSGVRQRRRAFMKPDKYDGKEDFDIYFETFELTADFSGLTTEERITSLAANLRGQARNFYHNLSSQIKCDYDRLVYQLQRRFGSESKNPVVWMTQFEQRKRQPGESAADFADALLLLASKAYPKMDEDARDSLALRHFYKSMPTEVEWRCLERGCTKLRDAEEVADLFESVMARDKKVRQVHFDQPSRDKNNDDSAEERPRSALKPSSRSSSPKGCFCCHDPTHYLMDCPLYKRCRSYEDKWKQRRSPSPSPHRSPQAMAQKEN